MRIAAIQMTSGTDVAANLRDAAVWIAQAAGSGAELVVLPEYFCLMGVDDTSKLPIAEVPGQGQLQDFLAAQAQRHSIWLVGGTIPLRTDVSTRCTNSTLVFDPSGVQQARYDKMHLFAFTRGQESYDESRVQQAGTQPVAFDLTARCGQCWRVGLSVCYDLRFPELYRALGADMLLVPSAFTYTTGQAHWEILLRARAIENLAFVAAAAQGGLHSNGRRTWGQSIVINPWGDVLNQLAQHGGVVIADCDYGQLHERRSQLPALQHRRL